MSQKTCCDYFCNLFFFLTSGVLPSPTIRVVQSFCIPKQSFGAVRNKMQPCMVLKLLPIFIARTSCRAQS